MRAESILVVENVEDSYEEIGEWYQQWPLVWVSQESQGLKA